MFSSAENNLQGAFTIKEIRELLQLPSIAFEPIPQNLLPPESILLNFPRARKRIVHLLEKGSSTKFQDSSKLWSLDFLLSPHSFHSSPENPNQLSHISFTRNQLDPSAPFSPVASGFPLLGYDDKAAQVDLPASTCFRSIGYQSCPLPGFNDLNIPFDFQRGIIPNDGQGRIINTISSSSSIAADSADETPVATHVPGLYCAGWVKRGPTGVIASTMTDAFATADAIATDMAHAESSNDNASDKPKFLNAEQGGSTGLGWDGVRPEAEKLNLHPTSWRDWEHIDHLEKERGQAKGKVREKFAQVSEMLDVLP